MPNFTRAIQDHKRKKSILLKNGSTTYLQKGAFFLKNDVIPLLKNVSRRQKLSQHQVNMNLKSVRRNSR
jgi:hypothetical protein